MSRTRPIAVPLAAVVVLGGAAWVAGEKAPFLPGAAVYELTLLP